MYLMASWKTFEITATVANADSWAETTQFADGSISQGNGTGSMKVGCWYKDHDGSEADPTLTFSATLGLIAGAVIIVFQKGGGDTWGTPGFVTKAMTLWTSGSAIQENASSSITVPDGAVVIGLAGIRDDTIVFSRPTDAIGSGSGTWTGNFVHSPALHLSTTTGNDMSADTGYRLFTSGGTGITLYQKGQLSNPETGALLWVVQGLGGASATSLILPNKTRRMQPFLAR